MTPWSRAWSWLALGVALVACLSMWGFTVDDALIPVRYARHLAEGVGYRFNAGGPVTDGVTPLPWAFVLAPLAHGGALQVLARAKILGVAVWAGAAWRLGRVVGRARAPVAVRAVGLIVACSALPVAAHAVSGMETAVAMALCTLAATSADRPRLAAGLAGVAAAFRPELAPWAATLGLGFALARPAPVESAPSSPSARLVSAPVLVCGAIALAPPLLCIAARLVVFGHPAPLAVQAKPSDLTHGAVYAVAALVVCATPALALAPFAVRRAPGWVRALAVALLVHALVVFAVGGDWMPYARLMAPVTPGLALVYVYSANTSRLPSLGLRGAAALALCAWEWTVAAPAGRHVMRDRVALVTRARPLLASRARVAALDIGWVSAATDADIVDLAGLTDPTIAALPGGHTSKHVDANMLVDRKPDALLVYVTNAGALTPATWRDRAAFGHAVTARLATSTLVEERFHAEEILPLGTQGLGYVLLTATPR